MEDRKTGRVRLRTGLHRGAQAHGRRVLRRGYAAGERKQPDQMAFH